MSPSVAVIPPDATVADAAACMRRSFASFVCVCDAEGRLLGVATERDLLMGVCDADARPAHVPVESVMSENFQVRLADDDAKQLDRTLASDKNARVFVLDAASRLQGVVTFIDLLHYDSPSTAATRALRYLDRRFRVRGRSPSGVPLAPSSHPAGQEPPEGP
jgi:CBS domain-containing protein